MYMGLLAEIIGQMEQALRYLMEVINGKMVFYDLSSFDTHYNESAVDIPNAFFGKLWSRYTERRNVQTDRRGPKVDGV